MKDIDVTEILRKTIEVNIADAEQMLKAAQQTADPELIDMAEQDLRKWQEKRQRLSES